MPMFITVPLLCPWTPRIALNISPRSFVRTRNGQMKTGARLGRGAWQRRYDSSVGSPSR